MVSKCRNLGSIIPALVTILLDSIYLAMIVCFIKNAPYFNPIQSVMDMAIPYIEDKMVLRDFTLDEVDLFRKQASGWEWHIFTFIELTVEVFTCLLVLCGCTCGLYELYLPFISLKIIIILKWLIGGSCVAFFLFSVDIAIALTWIMSILVSVTFMLLGWTLTFQAYARNFMINSSDATDL